jgi:hypothetical protein
MADDLFTLTGGGNTISFVLPASSDVSGFSMTTIYGFTFGGVPVTTNGVTTQGDLVDIYAVDDLGGGLDIDDQFSGDLVTGDLADLLSAQLLSETFNSSGIVQTVTFNLGDYSGITAVRFEEPNVYSGNFNIDISTYIPPAATPNRPASSCLAPD